MDSQTHGIRFAETPPGSPKSCMKGARKGVAFEDNPDPKDVASPKTPRKSVKVSIRSMGDSSSLEKEVPPIPPPLQKPPDIQFSQHYDQSTPPPNCTSNYGNYDFVESKVDDATQPDERNDPELVEIASKFVNEIIESAKLEAANRENPEEKGKPNITTIAREIFNAGRSGARRAQGTLSKWVTNLCVKAQNTIRT